MILIVVQSLGFLAEVAFRDGMRVVSADSLHFAAVDFYFDAAVARAEYASSWKPMAGCRS